MTRFLIGAFALAFAIASPAFAAHRSQTTTPARASVHVRAHSAAHARPAHRHTAHVRATTHGSHVAHHAKRRSAHETAHHRHTTTRRSRHTARHVSHRYSSRHPARHAVHNAVHHEVRRAAQGHAVKVPFAKVRKVVHAKRRFHAGTYRSPPGWFTHHWVMGERLPRPWFARDYWVMEWQIYGLWAPVDGLIWVRVGSDALLIDPDTGEIIGIEYDVFW